MDAVIVLNFVIIVCSFWVFIDSANNKIGTHTIKEGFNKGYKNGISPIIWGIGSFFILPFFIYLFRRKSLIKKAESDPVVTDKSIGFILMFLVSAVLVSLSL